MRASTVTAPPRSLPGRSAVRLLGPVTTLTDAAAAAEVGPLRPPGEHRPDTGVARQPAVLRQALEIYVKNPFHGDIGQIVPVRHAHVCNEPVSGADLWLISFVPAMEPVAGSRR